MFQAPDQCQIGIESDGSVTWAKGCSVKSITLSQDKTSATITIGSDR